MSNLDAELRRELRTAYDVRIILGELAERTRSVASRDELASLLQNLTVGCLHPQQFVCYFEAEDDALTAPGGMLPASLQNIPTNSPLLAALARRGKAATKSDLAAASEWAPFFALAPECLVPILGREGRLVGAMIFGQRSSGEPYSQQDMDLLDAVAGQVASVVESLRLAERMAERMESERRLRQEMELAKQVQARLFPQRLPPLRTLEYAGRCIQARQVGGDYYDFLELQTGRIAFVLADIAGKGLSGALLMANLQANLKSQYAMALADPQVFLSSVNRLFYENTGDSSYATLFFADYDDASRRLRYVNCGHLPPLLLRDSSGNTAGKPTLERLGATGTVLGLLKTWECDIGEVVLSPGDTVVIYTDGVTEATDENDAEFGEAGLLAVLDMKRSLPAPILLDAVLDTVQRFQHGGQADDITLVVARCRA